MEAALASKGLVQTLCFCFCLLFFCLQTLFQAHFVFSHSLGFGFTLRNALDFDLSKFSPQVRHSHNGDSNITHNITLQRPSICLLLLPAGTL